jgi:hypothetical protein
LADATGLATRFNEPLADADFNFDLDLIAGMLATRRTAVLL